jgi:hypothetical protein
MESYNILRSEPIPRASLKRTLDALRLKYANSDLDAWSAGKLDALELVCSRLKELSAFTEIINVVVRVRVRGAGLCRQLERTLHLGADVQSRAGGVSWTIIEQLGPKERHDREKTSWDCRLGAGFAQDGYWTSLLISSESRLWTNTEERRELFRKTISLWALEQYLRMVSHGDDFTITAHGPLQLTFQYQTPDNFNPKDMRVVGLPSLQSSLEAAQMAKDGLAEEVLETHFGCSLSREQYGQAYEQLNALWKGWNIEVRGTITQEAEDILNGSEVNENSPMWIPVCRWHEADGNARFFCSISIEKGDRLLEVAVDGGTSEMLRERVAFLNGIGFTSVYQGPNVTVSDPEGTHS